jgi:hypothetical protein
MKSEDFLVLALIGGLIFAIAKEQPATHADAAFDVSHARAFVAGDFAFADSKEPLPGPPAPTPGRCTICNGTGKVGDGRIFVDCGSCGGDGVVDSAIAEKLAPCACGHGCKCASDPNNPECRCLNCQCDPVQITLPDWKPVKPRKQLHLYRQTGQPLPITDKALEALQAAGWEIGPSGHIDVREAFPERPHGTWELEDGSAAPPMCWIDMTAKQVGAFYDTGIAPVPVKQKQWFRVCGPNGCRWVEQ